MAQRLPTPFSDKLTHAGKHLVELLHVHNRPVLSIFEFHRLVWRLYTEPTDKKLYLRSHTPAQADTFRLRDSLKDNGKIASDPDYGPSVLRILNVPDLPAEDIASLVDEFCYVSHLSAMQRWGLTDRHPESLIMSRPDRSTLKEKLHLRESALTEAAEENPFAMKIINHPHEVRGRPLTMYESKTSGAYVKDRSSEVRVATIGQTFLDMVQKPDLCGGMTHVLDVWQQHARTYLNEIIEAVDAARTDIAKVRAGYILEERMRLVHNQVEKWKALSQRGSSRKLDPDREFVSDHSEVWMLSLNV